MHFRVRKRVIQLIRTEYDESKKKGVATVVGTIKLDHPELSPELRRQMTDDEVAAFEAWSRAQHRAELLREELAALTLAETMANARAWFEREGNAPVARSTAVEIVSQWHALRKVFVKHGLLD